MLKGIVTTLATLIRLMLIWSTLEKYANVLKVIMFTTAGEEASWEKKIMAFIEAERALNLKVITTKKEYC